MQCCSRVIPMIYATETRLHMQMQMHCQGYHWSWNVQMKRLKTACAEYLVCQLEQLPVTVAALQEATSRDPVLAKVLHFVQAGWPQVVLEEMLKPYMERQLELSTKQGCLMWGICVVVLPTLQDKVLEELHGGHIGVIKMKALAHSRHVWWPGIDREIEGVTSRCKGCRAIRQDPKLTPILGSSQRGPGDGFMWISQDPWKVSSS